MNEKKIEIFSGNKQDGKGIWLQTPVKKQEIFDMEKGNRVKKKLQSENKDVGGTLSSWKLKYVSLIFGFSKL